MQPNDLFRPRNTRSTASKRKHPYLVEAFGLKLFSIKDTQFLLMVVIYGKIWDNFWNFCFSLSHEIEVKGGLCVKKWEFQKTKFFLKYQFFIRFNFVFMYYGQFPTKSSLKLRFVLFKSEKVTARRGVRDPCYVGYFLRFEKNKSQF